jgi:hypothetical protein
MTKKLLTLVSALALTIAISSAHTFRGTVTAVDSNANAPGYAFTAVNEAGHVKMFRIDNLKHLDLNDRVVVTYPSKVTVFPIRATTVKFLAPR